MKTKEQIYLELFEIWTNRVKTKKYTQEAFEFERNAGEEMLKLAETLADLTWKPQGYSQFKIHRPTRIINAPLYADRIAESWITENYLIPYVNPKVIKNNMACQKDKGSKKTMQSVKKALAEQFSKNRYDFWVLQYDMQGYYDNLSHDVIKKQISDIDKDAYKLFVNIIDAWSGTEETSYAKKNDKNGKYGIPKGNLPSQQFGILYLNELDHLITDNPDCLYYCRYMDDGIAFFKTKEQCKRTYIEIKKYLIKNRMGIQMHPRKTNYFPITTGFNFCGWHYSIKPSGKILVHIKQSKKKEMKKKIEHTTRQYQNGKISIVEANDVMRGCINYLSWGDTYHLRKYICKRYIFRHK